MLIIYFLTDLLIRPIIHNNPTGQISIQPLKYYTTPRYSFRRQKSGLKFSAKKKEERVSIISRLGRAFPDRVTNFSSRMSSQGSTRLVILVFDKQARPVFRPRFQFENVNQKGSDFKSFLRNIPRKYSSLIINLQIK